MIYDQIWVYNSVFKTFSTETLSTAARSYFLPLSRAAGRDGAARRDHPSQGHGSSPAALHQMPRCTADNRASIVPFKWCQDSSPSRRRLMLSYRSCRVPQRVMLQNAAPAKSNQYSRRSELKVRIASAATHGLPCA